MSRCRACGTPLDGPSIRWGLSRVCSIACGLELDKKRKRPSPNTERVPTGVIANVRARDGGRCRWCRRRPAQAHHILYRSQGGPHIESNLILLCLDHHAIIHSDKRYWQPLLLELVSLPEFLTIPQLLERKQNRNET